MDAKTLRKPVFEDAADVDSVSQRFTWADPERDVVYLELVCRWVHSPLPWGEVESRSDSGEGLGPNDSPYRPTLSRSKSDISDFDKFELPNSGKPELGGRAGALPLPSQINPI
jgi:hypothetical protein